MAVTISASKTLKKYFSGEIDGTQCMEVIEKNKEESYVCCTLDIDLDKYISDKDKAAILWNLIKLGLCGYTLYKG